GPPGAHLELCGLRLADVAGSALGVDDVRGLCLGRLAGELTRGPDPLDPGTPGLGLAGTDRHHRAPARSGQAALRLRGLLDLHRLLPVFLDLVRKLPRGNPLVHHPPVGVVEHAELGSLFRPFHGPVLPAPLPVDPTRPVLAWLSRSLDPGLPLPRSLLAHHARALPRGGAAGLAGRLAVGCASARLVYDRGPCLPDPASGPDRRSPSFRVDRFPKLLRSGSHDSRSNRSLSTEPG